MATKKTNEEENKKTTVKKSTETKKDTKKVEEVKETKKEEKKEETVKTISGLSEKGEVVLVYLLPIVGFVFALMKDKKVSEFMRFHYNQAGALWLTSMIISIGFGILGRFIPFSGLISSTLSIVLFVFDIIALVKAYSDDEKYEIPVVYDFSKTLFKTEE